MNMHYVRTWTPDLVAEVMIDSLRWAADTAGHVGPRGYARSAALSGYRATLEDHLREGWGLPEELLPDEPRIRRPYTAAELVILPRVLNWQWTYLGRDFGEVGRVLGVWLRNRAYRSRRWEQQWKDIGYSRGHAYRMRDRGLSLIAQGLHRDRVPLPEAISLSE